MSNVEDYLAKDIRFTPAVVGFLVNNNRVLLGLRKRVSLDLGLNIISGVGGKVGDKPEYADETIDEALRRELDEEIKIVPITYEWMGRVRFVWTHSPEKNQDVAIALISKWQGEPTETEDIKPEWYDADNLPKKQMWEDNIGNDHKRIQGWVPLVLQGATIDAVFVYGENKEVIAYKYFKISK